MRRITRRIVLSLVAVAATAAIVLTGCMVSSGGAGSLAIRFGSARALSAGESYRVDVYYGRDRFTTQTSPTPEIIVNDLPTGMATIYVAVGAGVGEAFVASRTGRIDLNIAAGDNQPDGLALSPVALDADTSAGTGAVTSVVASGGLAYAYTAAGLRSGPFGSLTDGPALPAGLTDVSLSLGRFFDGGTGSSVEQVWVNGSWTPDGEGGIIPWTGASLNLAFTDGFDLQSNWDGTREGFSILRSGAFFVNSSIADSGDGLAIFYQRNGGIGGVWTKRSEQGTVANWPWIMDQIDLSAELGSVLPAGQEPIVDFALGTNALYLVSSFTTMKISEGAIDPSNNVAAQDLFDSPYVGFAEGIPDAIVAIGLDLSPLSRVYLGTADGLWKGTTSTDSQSFFSVDGPATKVAATAGYGIRNIAVSADGKHVAFITERVGCPDSLAVIIEATGDVVTYRSMEGLPGETLNALTWLDADTLLVAGNAGLAKLDVAP